MCHHDSLTSSIPCTTAVVPGILAPGLAGLQPEVRTRSGPASRLCPSALATASVGMNARIYVYSTTLAVMVLFIATLDGNVGTRGGIDMKRVVPRYDMI